MAVQDIVTTSKDAIYDTLLDLARSGETATYGTVGEAVGLDMRRRGDRTIIGRVLDEIDLREHEAGRPQLSAVVVLKREGRPSRGFFALARVLGRAHDDDLTYWAAELRRVHAFWSGH